MSLCSITRVLVLLLVVCLVVCLGLELGRAVETFATDDANLTPGDRTYFTISPTDPSSQTRTSSDRLQQELQEQRGADGAESADNSTEQETTTDDDMEATSTVPYAYWFWNGSAYARKSVAETLHIINIWKDNCPNNCRLWIQIGEDTMPLNVASTTNVGLRVAVQGGVDNKRKSLRGCYTPASETPDKDFTCIPCAQQSQLNQSPIFQDWHNDPRRTVSTSGHDIVHTDNYWYFLPEYIAKTATTALVQKVFTIQQMCPSTCKLVFHGGSSRPLVVDTTNEAAIRTIVQSVKDRGAQKGITLCCALKDASIDTMYDAASNTFNCERCSNYILSDSGSVSGSGSSDSSGTDTAFYSSYASPQFGPSLMTPKGPQWSSSGDQVSPYATTMSNQTLCGAASNPPPTQQLLYGNASPQNTSESEGTSSCAGTPSCSSCPVTNTVFHQHVHTFTNSATRCNTE